MKPKKQSLPDFDVVVTDLHHRITGVGATIRSLLPLQIKSERIVLVANSPQPGIAQANLSDVLHVLKSDRSRLRIWHARRNNEMAWGIFAKTVLRANIKLVFTSAAIRKHSWYPRMLIGQMDHIIATTSKAASFVGAQTVIPHSVDTHTFAHNCWENKQNLIAIIGRVRPEKGTDRFIRMCCDVLPKYPGWRAIVVGKTTAKYEPFKRSLMEQLAKNGLTQRVEFIDEVPFQEMPNVYKQTRLVVAPARYEGFGLVPMEAMAAGAAVLATDTGAYSMMIKPNQTGILVEKGCECNLSKHLAELLSDEDALLRMQQEAQRDALERFDLTKEAEAINAVYHQLLANTEVDTR